MVHSTKQKIQEDFPSKNEKFDSGHVAIEEWANTQSLSKPLTMWLFFRALTTIKILSASPLEWEPHERRDLVIFTLILSVCDATWHAVHPNKYLLTK